LGWWGGRRRRRRRGRRRRRRRKRRRKRRRRQSAFKSIIEVQILVRRQHTHLLPIRQSLDGGVSRA
jgi:hypothetical protein